MKQYQTAIIILIPFSSLTSNHVQGYHKCIPAPRPRPLCVSSPRPYRLLHLQLLSPLPTYYSVPEVMEEESGEMRVISKGGVDGDEGIPASCPGTARGSSFVLSLSSYTIAISTSPLPISFLSCNSPALILHYNQLISTRFILNLYSDTWTGLSHFFTRNT